MRKWKPPVAVAEAVQQTLVRLGLDAGVRQREVWRVWGSVVGPQIARHAQPHTVSHGRLIVHVTDSVWLHQLSMMRHRLLAALQEAQGGASLREIVLRVGEVEVPPIEAGPQAEPESPVAPERRAAIRELVGSLGDAPCRDALERLLTRAARSVRTEKT
jgi:hypothetical protein